MKHGEDIRMGLRWIRGRPVESLLLIFGISLGIGATAAGIALAGRTGQEARKTLSSVAYREIVVDTREEADEMDLPAIARTSTDFVVLTTEDLAARDVAPDVQYAYAANPRGLRFGSTPEPMRVQRSADGQTATAGTSQVASQTATEGATSVGTVSAGGSGAAAAPTSAGASAASVGASSAQTAAQSDVMMPPDGMGPPGEGGPFGSMQQEPEAPEGPQPVIEEARAWEVTPEFFSAYGMTPAQGSLFTTEDIKQDNPVLVLGSTLGATLFEDGVAFGRKVLADRQIWSIVGILEPTGTDYDLAAFSPASQPELQGFGEAARRFRGFNTTLHFTVSDYTKLEQARTQLTAYFTQNYGEGAVIITIPRYEAEAARDRSSRLVTVILFLALSALVISAANVTNILFARALRKRRSVGILKALGATRRNVFQLFFLEASVIGVAGAGVGALLSVLLSKLMQDTMGFGAIYVSLLAVGIVGATGLVTALDVFPAMQAARTPASEAIRYE